LNLYTLTASKLEEEEVILYAFIDEKY